jgi:hypothetical protein
MTDTAAPLQFLGIVKIPIYDMPYTVPLANDESIDNFVYTSNFPFLPINKQPSPYGSWIGSNSPYNAQICWFGGAQIFLTGYSKVISNPGVRINSGGLFWPLYTGDRMIITCNPGCYPGPVAPPYTESSVLFFQYGNVSPSNGVAYMSQINNTYQGVYGGSRTTIAPPLLISYFGQPGMGMFVGAVNSYDVPNSGGIMYEMSAIGGLFNQVSGSVFPYTIGGVTGSGWNELTDTLIQTWVNPNLVNAYDPVLGLDPSNFVLTWRYISGTNGEYRLYHWDFQNWGFVTRAALDDLFFGEFRLFSSMRPAPKGFLGQIYDSSLGGLVGVYLIAALTGYYKIQLVGQTANAIAAIIDNQSYLTIDATGRYYVASKSVISGQVYLGSGFLDNIIIPTINFNLNVLDALNLPCYDPCGLENGVIVT